MDCVKEYRWHWLRSVHPFHCSQDIWRNFFQIQLLTDLILWMPFLTVIFPPVYFEVISEFKLSIAFHVFAKRNLHSFSKLFWCPDIREKIIPGVTHWQSPSYFAYYPSNSSTAGFLGEMLSAAFNIVGFSWITSPAATELEVIVLDWFAKMLKLPSKFLSSGKAAIIFFSLMHKLFVDHNIYFCNSVLYM